MHSIEVALAVAAGLALIMGLFTHWIRVHWINEPLLALLLGILVGPVGLGWLDLAEHGNERAILEMVAHFTLAIVLVSVGMELRKSLSTLIRPLMVLAIAGTALMWAASGLIVWLLLDISVLEAVLLGAILAPIDPILTATVTLGKIARQNVPERLRHMLAAEASVRHAIGLLFVLLPAFLLVRPDSEAWGDWFTEGLLWKGVASLAFGVFIGYVVGRLDRWSAEHDHAEDRAGDLAPVFIALALALVAFVTLMDGDGILALLGAAIAFALARVRDDDAQNEQIEQQRREYTELIKQVLQVFIFVLLGTALPWSDWQELGWTAPAIIVAILLLRRIPAILALKPFVPDIRTRDEALFVGWFGPVGIGALYFAAVAHTETQLDILWTVTTLVVAASIVAHDLTATPLSRLLKRRSSDNHDVS